KAAREEEGVDAEPGEQLRQLRRMPEAVGHVSGRRRRGTMPPAHLAAEQQVAHERLADDEEFVRQHVARSYRKPARGEQGAQPRLVLRPQLQIVLEHDRLSVERERTEALVVLQRREDVVDATRELE